MLDFLNLKKMISQLNNERSKLLNRLEDLKKEREGLEHDPMCKEDLINACGDMVDKAALQGLSDLKHSLPGIANRPMNDFSGHQPHMLKGFGGEAINLNVLCFILNDAIKDGIRRAIETGDYVDDKKAGPLKKDRLTRIASVDAEIEKIEKNLTVLDNQADSAGLRPNLFSVSGEKEIRKRG